MHGFQRIQCLTEKLLILQIANQFSICALTVLKGCIESFSGCSATWQTMGTDQSLASKHLNLALREVRP